METLLLFGQIFLAVFAFANVAIALYENRNKLGFVLAIWKRVRVKMFFETFGILIFTITAVIVLFYFVPLTKWGWANLFFHDGGNVLLKPMIETSKSSNFLIRLVAPLFFLMFLVMAPFFTKIEEEIFRKGHHEWGQILWQSIKFGFVHMIVGVPLAAGIALCGVGLFYACKYKKAYDRLSCEMPHAEAEEEAILVSTAYHTLYNSLVVMILLIPAIILL